MNKRQYPQDSTGEIILPGDLVAYNRSGDVILGRVIAYSKRGTTWRNEPEWTVEIVAEDVMAVKDWRSQPKSKVSRVKNTRGIRVVG